ncbi:MAG: sodium:solute symporter, partial [Streptosporangiaceae bacterium]
DASPAHETRVAQLASLIVKAGALVFVLALSKTFSINLQLLGGSWILQTFPSIVAGLYTRWFHRWALLVGWAAAMVWGTIVAYNQPVAGEPGTHFGGSTAIVPGLGHTAYIAVTAFVLNVVVAVLLTWVFRTLKLREGADETSPDEYVADPEDPSAEPAAQGSYRSAS